ncbi:MAG: hypothetical protein HY054_11385 [Proteobacteria bacterium]|nr:hypothetical protein [Pseudomonadota bacterium]
MSESSWILRGVDDDARERAVEEAARRGISLSDYLTDIVLQNASAEQTHQRPTAPAEDGEPSPLTMGDKFAIRHQIKALERRLGSSVTSLDGALNALDTSVFDLTSRVGDLEALAGDTGAALGGQLKDLQGSLAVLRLGLSGIEEAAKAAGDSNNLAHATLADACAELEHRLGDIETISRGADRAAAQLAEAQHAYRISVAQDIESLSRETAAHLNAGLEEVRAAADEAAAQADAAAAHLVAELRSLRLSIDKRLVESAAETKHRMHAAFAENAERLTGLSDRVAVHERQSERQAEQARAQLADVEVGMQGALEETALALRRADAVLAADIVRMGENNRTALTELRSDMAAETAAMHERHLAGAARIANAETQLSAVSEQATTRQEALDRRLSATTASFRDALDQVDTTISEQFDATALRATELEQDIAHVRRTLGAEINRVEACTLAALEKQAQDRLAGDEATHRTADKHAASMRVAIEDMRARLEEQMTTLRGQHANAQARLEYVNAALADDGPLATVISATAEEVASLRTRVLGIQGADRDVLDRLKKLEVNDTNTTGTLNALRVDLGAMAAQAPAQIERLAKLEVSIADLRLDQLANAASAQIAAEAEALAAVQARVTNIEERQADALHRLSNEITQFVAENDRRLSLLEETDVFAIAAPFAAIEQRLGELEHRDIGTAFAELRARIEERILGVEQRNVRTLEQLSATVELIERRFADSEADAGVARSA